MRRLHRVTRPAFRERTDCGRVTEQFGERNFRVNNREMTAGLDAVNAAATTAQVAANVALRFFRRDVFDLHDRLEQKRGALCGAVFHCEDRRQFEWARGRMHCVESRVYEI